MCLLTISDSEILKLFKQRILYPLLSTTWNCLKVNFLNITIFFLIILLVYSSYKNILTNLTYEIAILGAIFTILKYKLDKANYNNSLFDKRLKVFLEIDQVLSDAFQDIPWQTLSKRLDSVFRTGYFLFGKKTRKFLAEFRTSVITYSSSTDKSVDSSSKQFLVKLLDGQNLSDQFPELKIQPY